MAACLVGNFAYIQVKQFHMNSVGTCGNPEHSFLNFDIETLWVTKNPDGTPKQNTGHKL
jgi:hypothetical protein